MPIQNLQPVDLRNWLDDTTRQAPVLIDVREPWETEICKIRDSISIPMNTIEDRYALLNPDVETVVICHHGARSMQVALFLERSGFKKLHNLAGGVDAWARQIDPAMSVY
jgi:rhodanese-related sulfurtransferase